MFFRLVNKNPDSDLPGFFMNYTMFAGTNILLCYHVCYKR